MIKNKQGNLLADKEDIPEHFPHVVFSLSVNQNEMLVRMNNREVVKQGVKCVPVLLVIWCFISSVVCCVLYRGLGTHGGDSGFYLKNAKEIIQNGVVYYIDHIRTPYYWGYPTFLAVITSIVGNNYSIISVIQIALASLSMVLLYRIIYDITSDVRISLIVPVLYRFIIDVWMWDCYILSDSLGATLEICTIYSFWRYQQKKGSIIPLICCSILFFCTRTNSLVLILVFFLFAFLEGTHKQKRIWWICFILFIFATIMLFVYSNNETHGLPARLSYYEDLFQSGIIIKDKPTYDYLIPKEHNGMVLLFDYSAVYLKRLLFFWSIYYNDYSLAHKIFQLITLPPLWFFALYSAWRIIRQKYRILYPYVVGIVAYNAVQALTEIDYDMRYRMPIFPLVSCVCAYGVQRILLQGIQRNNIQKC